MTDPKLTPCVAWEENLAATYLNDLAPTEREELNTHVATCPACQAILADYREMDALIRDTLIVKGSLQLWRIFTSATPEQKQPSPGTESGNDYFLE